MFDPARDDDGHRPFARRLLLIAVVGALASVALWPSISGYRAGPDGEHPCIAIVDALRHDSGAPSAADDSGACIPESRHRLLLTVTGLGALTLLVAVTVAIRARQAARRRAAALALAS